MEPEPLNQRSKLILDTYNQQEDTRVWLKASNNQHSLSSATSDISINQHLQDTTPISDLLITPEFLRKYIYFAKNRIQPVLSDTAMELISQAYAEMRSKQTSRTLPVTARSLETIIRLANANAKCRLSQSVDEVDVEAALELMNFVLYHEVGATGNDEGEGRTGTGVGQSGTNNNSSTIIDKENTHPSSNNNSNKNRNSSNRRKRGKGQNYDLSMDTDNDDEEEEESNIYDKKTRIESLYDNDNNDNNDNNNTTLTTLTSIDHTSTRYQYVMTNVLALSSVYGDNFTIHNVLEKINSSLSESNAGPYTAAGVLSPLSPAPLGSSTSRSSGGSGSGVGGKYEYSELEGILKALEGENKVCIYLYWYILCNSMMDTFAICVFIMHLIYILL